MRHAFGLPAGKGLLLALWMITLPSLVSSQPADDEYDKQWIKVEAFIAKALPESALEVTDQIYNRAKKENNQPQQVKASIYKIEILKSYEEDAEEKAILLMQEELKTAAFPASAIYHSILAESYYQYYAGNRYQWYNRTVTRQIESEDMKTWDLQKLISRVIHHHLAAVSDAARLQKISRTEYQVLLQEEIYNNNDERQDAITARPTLYDFLVHRAVDRFMQDETSLTRPADHFQIDNPLYLSSYQDFTKLNLSTTDTLSLKYHALKLLQDILSFHKADEDPTALIDADLKRLDFVKNQGIIDNKDQLYLQVLEKLQNTFINSPASAEVAYKRAQFYASSGGKYHPYDRPENKNDLKQAVGITAQMNTLHPKSKGAKNCRVLTRQILEPGLSLIIDDVVVPDQAVLGLLTYKNVEKAFYRILAIDPLKDKEIRQSGDSKKMLKHYLSMEATLSGSFSLPIDSDYNSHKVQVPLPAVAPGYYLILLSQRQDFIIDSVPVAYTTFWSSNLSYISRKNESNEYEIFILDRKTGEPVKGATVEGWTTDYDYKSRTRKDQLWKSLTTDNQGYVKFSSPGEKKTKSFYLYIRSAGEKLTSEEYFYISDFSRGASNKRESTFIFTDRAIYRPGQPIYYKGIMLEGEGNDLKVRPGFKTLVVLYDVNGRLLEEDNVTTNEFGSFSGTFTAPQGILNGRMRISNEYGSAEISVEEYKRPRFETKLQPVEGEYSLDSEITLQGKASTYSGNPVDGATVRYRVIRRASFPYYFYGRIRPQSAVLEVTNGVTTTGSSGEFEIVFKAIPDKSIQKSSYPVFSYQIVAEVTDINGETRTGSCTVSASYASFVLSSDIPEVINADELPKIIVAARNLSGQNVQLTGKLRITQLQPPEQLYRERKWDRPDKFLMDSHEFRKLFPFDLYDNEEDKSLWERMSVRFEKTLQMPADSIISLQADNLIAGDYVLEFSAIGKSGDTITYNRHFKVFSPSGGKSPGKVMKWVSFPKDPAEPGTLVKVFLASASKNVNLLYEIIRGKAVIHREWLKINNEMITVPIAVTEEYRGNIGVNFIFIKNNRFYQETGIITVPFTQKELDISFETFRDHLQPGQKEEWRLKVSGKMKEKILAEMLLSMYDASLDAFLPHRWNFDLYTLNHYVQPWKCLDVFSLKHSSQSYFHSKPSAEYYYFRKYDRLIKDVDRGTYLYGMEEDLKFTKGVRTLKLQAAGMDDAEKSIHDLPAKAEVSVEEEPGDPGVSAQDQVLLAPARSDLKETAFFFPDLMTNEKGDVLVQFILPESLTRWKIMGLAHTKDLKTGFVTKDLTARKDIMVFPYPPRFFRTGDKVAFSTKVSSMAKDDLSCKVKLQLFDAISMKEISKELISQQEQEHNIPGGGSVACTWDLIIPAGYQAIGWRVSASAGKFTDGEESTLPVLNNRTLVTESLPLPVKGIGKFEFNLSGLAKQEINPSKSLQNHQLSLEFTPNPAWYAIQALPYMMEYPHDCSEQVFSRFYANQVASHIASYDPNIQKVFDSWSKFTPSALLSNLEKNTDLKSLVLEETPWVMQARDESERKQRIGLLFDLNRMANEISASTIKLAQLQTPNGGWPWFAGMPDDRYITQYILSGYGHLLKLGIFKDGDDEQYWQMIIQGISYADARIQEDYRELQKHSANTIQDNHLNHSNIQYLYLRSFFIDRAEIGSEFQEAVNYYTGQSKKYWTTQNPYMQGMIALALHRMGDVKTPKEILISLKQRALRNEEMGMYWRDGMSGHHWHQQGIGTQSLLIEAFHEINHDSAAVEEMKLWLLKQKQTTDWKTTTATADACYALLLTGDELLKAEANVEIKVGNIIFNPGNNPEIKTEAGSGYFRHSWWAGNIAPEMSKVTIVKSDKGAAWGALYWQYFEDLDKINSANTSLKIDRQLYLKKNTASGPVLESITPGITIKTGEKVVVRITLVTDRNLEYVHLKDHRAAGLEPADVLSGYNYQDGIGYYQSTKDAATHFFFSYLPKGTRIFEYTLNASQRGDFSMGISNVECMYAPEFKAHSAGLRIKIE
ncbi:MAG: alpha-2-macroglobulin [Bacteroidales bacterium]